MINKFSFICYFMETVYNGILGLKDSRSFNHSTWMEYSTSLPLRVFTEKNRILKLCRAFVSNFMNTFVLSLCCEGSPLKKKSDPTSRSSPSQHSCFVGIHAIHLYLWWGNRITVTNTTRKDNYQNGIRTNTSTVVSLPHFKF